jgi:hypothetical protein
MSSVIIITSKRQHYQKRLMTNPNSLNFYVVTKLFPINQFSAPAYVPVKKIAKKHSSS